MRKFTIVLVFLIMGFAGIITAQSNVNESASLLLDDSGEAVGTFDIAIQGNTLTAEFTLTAEGYCLQETTISTEVGELAANGDYDEDCARSDSYTLPKPRNPNTITGTASLIDTSINGELTGIEFGETATLTNFDQRADDAYWSFQIEGAGFSGMYSAWCAEFAHFLRGPEYEVEVLPLDASNGIVDPDRVNEMLWIADNTGMYLAEGASVETVQYGMWLAINSATADDIIARYGDEIDIETAEQIATDALENGADYSPACGVGGANGVILNPINTYPVDEGEAQEVFVPIMLPCPPEALERTATAVIELREAPEETPEPRTFICHNDMVLELPLPAAEAHLRQHDDDFEVLTVEDRERCLNPDENDEDDDRDDDRDEDDDRDDDELYMLCHVAGNPDNDVEDAANTVVIENPNPQQVEAHLREHDGDFIIRNQEDLDRCLAGSNRGNGNNNGNHGNNGNNGNGNDNNGDHDDDHPGNNGNNDNHGDDHPGNNGNNGNNGNGNNGNRNND